MTQDEANRKKDIFNISYLDDSYNYGFKDTQIGNFLSNSSDWLYDLINKSDEELKELGYLFDSDYVKDMYNVRNKIIKDAYANSKHITDFREKLVGMLSETDLGNAENWFIENRSAWVEKYGNDYQAALNSSQKGERIDGVNYDVVLHYRKDKVLENLKSDTTIDLSEIINNLKDGELWDYLGIAFSEEELERIRVEKVWQNYRLGKYNILDENNNVDQTQTLKHVLDILDNTLGEEDRGKMGNDEVGMFANSFISAIVGDLDYEKLSKFLDTVVNETLSVENSIPMGEMESILSIINKDNNIDYETLLNNIPVGGTIYNLHNYYITKGDNALGRTLSVSGQVEDIMNK